MSEAWKPVPGCEGLYEVSDAGRLRRLTRREGYHSELLHEPVLVTPKRAGKYLAATLSRDGWKKRFYIHQLVLLAFRGPRPGKATGSHLDGDHDNNSLANLDWESMSANHRRKRDHGTMLRGEVHPQSKLTQQKVDAIRSSKSSHADLAELYGVSRGRISQIKRGEGWDA